MSAFVLELFLKEEKPILHPVLLNLFSVKLHNRRIAPIMQIILADLSAPGIHTKTVRDKERAK